MIVPINELENYFEFFIKACKKNHITSFNIDTDYYWLVGQDDRYNFKDTPKDLHVGSLVDDLESLRKLLAHQEDFSLVDIDRLSNLLSAIGYSIEKKHKPWLLG